MAEGKKSFIVYTNWYDFLEELNNEQLGATFRWMMEYCNDMNPEYPKDIPVKMSIKVIQPILKSDLKKYENKVESINKAREKRKYNIENNIDTNNEINTEINKDNNQCNMLIVNCNNDNCNNDIISNDINNNKKNISSEPRELALELPTIYDYKKGNIYPVYQDQIDKWQEVYIGVDVNLELNKMLVWLEANPSKKKTYNGMARFIVNWLSRQQDSAARNGIVNQINENERRPNETEAEYKKRMNGGFDTL